jgi:hypothetical protein
VNADWRLYSHYARHLICCRYYVVTDRWQKFSDLVVDGATLGALAKSCSEFLVHGVDVEGRKLGVDERLVEMLGAYTSIPTTYAGGVGSMVWAQRMLLHSLPLMLPHTGFACNAVAHMMLCSLHHSGRSSVVSGTCGDERVSCWCRMI